MEPEPPIFFLSLSVRASSDSAKGLIEYLNKRNLKSWCCISNLVEGQQFRNEIVSNVSKAPYFVIFLTDEWVISKECQYEYNMAEKLNRRRGSPLIVPIVVDPTIEDRHEMAFAIMANYQGIFVEKGGNISDAWPKIANLAASQEKPKEEPPTPKLVRQVSNIVKNPTPKQDEMPKLERQLSRVNLKPNKDVAIDTSNLREKQIEYENGDIYNGQINEKNQRHGQGSLTLHSGSKYEGGFKNDKYWGNGIYEYSSGAKYQGGFKDGKFDGTGSYKTAMGHEYSGEFVDDMFHGQGIYTTVDGNVYKGMFKQDKKHGAGEFRMAKSGNTYVGNFDNGKFSGEGTYTYKNGTIFIGEFKNGLFHGKGRVEQPNGAIYEGNFKNDMYNGRGVYVFVDQRRYEGQFKNNQFNGRGKLTYPNGNVYEGQFQDDKYHGYGVFNIKGGKTLSGNWVNGEWQIPKKGQKDTKAK